MSQSDRRKLVRQADVLFRDGAISAKARDYLTDWAQSVRRRAKRPAEYNFLQRRFDSRFRRAGPAADPRTRQGETNRLVIKGLAGEAGQAEPLPQQPESDDDADGQALVVQAD